MGFFKRIKQDAVQVKLMRDYIIPAESTIIVKCERSRDATITCIGVVFAFYEEVLKDQGIDNADIFLDIMYENDRVKKLLNSSYGKFRDISISDFKKTIKDEHMIDQKKSE